MSSRKSVDIGRIVLPQPPKEYGAEYMRMLNLRIQELIASRLGKDEWLTAGSAGVPLVHTHGTNAAFAIAAGASINLLPFNTIDLDYDNYTTFQTSAFTATALYAGTYFVNFFLKHNANPSVGYGTDNKIVNLYAYKNGVEYARLAQLLVVGALISASFILTFAQNDVIDVRLNSPLIAFNVDMTLSNLWLMRISSDPRLGVI